MKMELTDIDKRVLDDVWSRVRRREPPNAQALDEAFQFLSQFPRTFGFTARPADWAKAASGLVEKGLLIHEQDTYSLTEKGQTYARHSSKEINARDSDSVLLSCEQSQAYHTFCDQVYGKDLCQHSMMTMAQMKKLLAVLDLDDHSRVLDMGCGSGLITEYISDVTLAAVTGIDLARDTIERAQARSSCKRDRLTFGVDDMDDMDDLAFPDNSFDTIISIDTLYFVENRSKTVARMKRVLEPDGQMGIFYTQSVIPDESKERLEPEKTDIAEALMEVRLPFRFWDLTQEEGEFWKRFVAVAEELEPALEAEGNTELFKLNGFRRPRPGNSRRGRENHTLSIPCSAGLRSGTSPVA
jgi:2-polyprenyl-3-methyl-5-hydroxy-6-metoxy-1,4-benzoquinol methylase